MQEKKLRKLIINKLKEYKIPQSYNGYFYLVDAVTYLIEKSKMQTKIPLQEIYYAVAEKHNITYSKVERNIRTIKHLFFYKNKKINNSKFIYGIAFDVYYEISEKNYEM